jgi:DNA (cytosine-5)-methyltransferase 1
MTKYSCEKCAKTFSQKSHYDKHINRKKTCEIQTDKLKALIDKAVCEKIWELNKKLISNNSETNITIKITEQMDISKMNKFELLAKCKELGIKKYSSKKKSQLIELINNYKLIELINNYKNSEIIQPINNNISNDILLENTLQTEPQSELKLENTLMPETEPKPEFTFIDLFCGIGGFHQALTNIKGKCVFASDINEDCRKIYEENYGLKPEGDITKINIEEIPPFDVLCGGFPCQPFSKAGFQKGFEDDRGNLFFNICNIIKKHNPKYLLLENVRNLSSHDDGNTWKVIYDNIDKLGYYTYNVPLILNVLHFNVPQNRERVIIMCKRKDLGELPILPIIPKNPKTTLTKYIKDIVCDDSKKNSIDGKLKDTETVWNSFIKLLILNNIEMPKFPIWTDWWDNKFQEKDVFYIKYKSWIDKNRKFFQENKNVLLNWLQISRTNKNWVGAVRKFEWQAGDLKKDDSMNNVLWSSRGSGIRVKRCDYIPTLVAMAMTPIYGPESRRLSARELLRLQSFPDNFKFDEKTIYKQVGNSVNVKMIENCARFLILNENLL